MNFRNYTILLLLICFIISSFVNSNKLVNDKTNIQLTNLNQPSNKSQTIIPLKFNKEETESHVQIMNKSLIKEIYKEKIVYAGKFIIFSKVDDQESLHGGFDSNDIFYDLGKVSMFLIPQDIELISIDEIEFCGKTLFRIGGIIGANVAQSNFFLLKDKKPVSFLSIEGNIKEFDLDRDGQIELISSSGTAAYTHIYKCEDNYVTIADLNAALGAEAVIFSKNEEAVFEVYYKEQPNKPKFFIFNGTEMVLVEKYV